MADKGGAAQISTAMRVLAEIIASDVSLLVTFNHAINGVIQNNPKARFNSKALAQLDGYKRPLVSSLSGNLQRFGMDKVHKLESLQEIIAEMSEDTGAAFGHKQPRMTASAESKRLYQELKPLSECGKDSLCGCRIFGWRALRLLLGPRQTVNLPANKRAAQHNEIHPCFISQSDPKIVSNTYRLSLSAGAESPNPKSPGRAPAMLQSLSLAKAEDAIMCAIGSAV